MFDPRISLCLRRIPCNNPLIGSIQRTKSMDEDKTDRLRVLLPVNQQRALHHCQFHPAGRVLHLRDFLRAVINLRDPFDYMRSSVSGPPSRGASRTRQRVCRTCCGGSTMSGTSWTLADCTARLGRTARLFTHLPARTRTSICRKLCGSLVGSSLRV